MGTTILQQITNFGNIPIIKENHGKGDTVGERLLLSAKTSAAFFPMMIRVTLAVIFVNTQIMAVILVQFIKAIFIFVQVYEKITDKHKEGMWMTQKDADKYNNKKKDEEVNESSSILPGDASGGYGTIVQLKKRNNIRF